MLAAVTAEAVAGFLPWIRSGHRQRSGFELIDSVRTLHVLDSGLQKGLALAWYLVPLAAALCWLAVLLDRRRSAALLSIGTGVLGTVVALSVERAAVSSLIGVHATLTAALAAAVGGTVELVEGGRHELANGPH
jgi:hypothetical protein